MTGRRVVVILPENLLAAVDKVVNQEYASRSAFIRLATQRYLEECLLKERKEKMARGYEKMGKINLELAEEGIADDANEMEEYLKTLLVGESH